jgi:hypothetical protein
VRWKNHINSLNTTFFKLSSLQASFKTRPSVDVVTGLDWANINTLDLFLTGDAVTNTISAAYRVNSNTGARLTTKNFKPSQPSSFFAGETNARAGILAFTGDAPNVPVTFDNFGIAQDVTAIFR